MTILHDSYIKFPQLHYVEIIPSLFAKITQIHQISHPTNIPPYFYEKANHFVSGGAITFLHGLIKKLLDQKDIYNHG